MASLNLFGRAFNLTLGTPPDSAPYDAKISEVLVTAAYKEGKQGLDISGFDTEFSIQRTLKPEPPKCQIRVYNLSKDNQKKLGSHKNLVVQLQAGYQGQLTLVYFGTASNVWTERDDTDEITHIESGDGEQQFASSRLNHTTSKQGALVPVATALQTIVDALGIEPGNVAVVIPLLAAKGVKTIPGGALSGSAAKRLTDLLLSIGYTWSIQNGALQLLGVNSVLNPNQSLICSSDTGMVGSPAVDSKGIVSAKMLMIPGVLPGALVTFQSDFLTGTYKIQQTHHHGQTWGEDWYVGFKGVKFAP